MKIGIISDSHDHHDHVLKAISKFKEKGVEYILHCGDMVSPFTARAFADAKPAIFIAVFGNCDGDKHNIADAIEEFGGEIHKRKYKGSIAGRKIYMTHIPIELEKIAQSGDYDLVLYGHTHKKQQTMVGKTLVVNPGETTDWVTGESSVAIIDLENMTCEFCDL